MSEKKVSIPKIGDAEVERRRALHLPLVLRNGSYLTVPPHDIRSTAYPWLEKLGAPATPGRLLGAALTLHGYGYHGFFKPSVHEVLCQVPQALLDVPTWFVVHGPDTADDFYKSLDSEAEALVREVMEEGPDDSVKRAFDAGFHTARTLFFAR